MDNVVRYKIRLVVKHYLQVFGIDFNEIYDLVAKFTTIRTTMIIEVEIDLEIHQINIEINFLNRNLEEDIHIDQS